MNFRRSWAAPLLCVAALMASVQARNVFVIPNTTGITQNITVLSGDSFTPVGTISNVVNVAQALSTPAGDKIYLITKTTTPAVIVVNGSTLALTGKTFQFAAAPAAAAMTPDGRRLVVVADTVHIIDTATDTELTNGFALATASTLADVVISPDSTMAYVLSKPFSGASSQITVLDLTTNSLSAVNPLILPGAATTISIGPNGLLYATAPSNFYEIDPRTLRIRADVSVGGTPGKPAFTSDALGAIVANQTPSSGAPLTIVNLSTRQPVAIPLPGFSNNVVDRLVLGNGGHIYAYSSAAQTIYDITPSNSGSAPATFGLLTLPGNVLSIATSPELPPQQMFVSTPGTVYRVDLAQGQITGTQPTSATSTILSYSGAARTGTATQLLTYNSGESAAVNTLFVPILVRAVDSTGKPLSGVLVNFTATGGATLTPANTTTNADGYAVTNVMAPASVGPVQVTATAPGSSATAVTIALNAVQSTPGGGGSDNSGLLTIVSGNGQFVREQFPTSEELVVQVNDTSGKPVKGAPVNFVLTSGSGALRGGDINSVSPTCTGAGQSITCTTDEKGQARAIFFASNLTTQAVSYETTTITASSGNSTVTFTEITYLGGQFGQTFPPPSVGEIAPGLGERNISARVGQVVPAAIQVRVLASGGPQLGFPIPGVSVRVTSDNPDIQAACSGPGGIVLTDSNGVGTCDLVVTGKPGTAVLSAIVGGANIRPPIFLTVTAGTPTTLKVAGGNNQSGNIGQQLNTPLSVQLLDQFGTPLAGQTVTWEVATAGTVTLSTATTTTDTQGNASVTAKLGNTPGAQVVRARAGSNLVASFTLNVIAPVGGIVSTSGGGQTAAINKAFSSPLVVKVTNTSGNAIPNVAVSFAVTSGSATLSANSATTDANGNASVTVTAGNTPGPVVVTATTGNFSTTFNLTVQPNLFITSVVNGANFFPGLAPGAIAVITGTGIAGGNQGVILPTNIVGPLPLTLGGVSVKINGVSAPLFAVANVNGAEQINFQVPFELTPGVATVVVTTPAGTAQQSNVTVQAVQPAIFENVDANNQRYAVAQRLTDGAYITPTTPVTRGTRVRVYLTGLGQTNPTAVTNQVGTTGQKVLAPVIVGINNAGVPFETAEYLPGANGVYMVTFTIPMDAPTGPYVPLSFGEIAPDGSVAYSQGSTISIQ